MRIAFRLVFCVCLLHPVFAQEQVTLTTPISVSGYRLEQLTLFTMDFIDGCRITVLLQPTTGEQVPIVKSYDGATACTMIKALNTADLTKQSLQRRVMERLITDNVIVGTVSGTPPQ